MAAPSRRPNFHHLDGLKPYLPRLRSNIFRRPCDVLGRCIGSAKPGDHPQDVPLVRNLPPNSAIDRNAPRTRKIGSLGSQTNRDGQAGHGSRYYFLPDGRLRVAGISRERAGEVDDAVHQGRYGRATGGAASHVHGEESAARHQVL